ncbi:hypothetical protein DDZ13_09270 [Coraliomargarita sinensis]|uniref:Tetratricopeptide repeat protein n=1 Tax=Coraliomargarita sinensis TaxID=2174842 RepID=A0A317ZHX4_9BACT|nr:tetratricopeptide repeat protein [Coraliomargarita sinensis]PXA03823.1 hypothetical protein DDZ13_09270 [Coraliomargarita sinensis]
MFFFRPLVSCLLIISFLTSAHAEEVTNEKALKYHELLLKRPDSEVIFTRFYDEWLASASIQELEQFLLSNAESGGARDWHVLAVFYLERGEEGMALEAYQSATELAPEDGELWLSRAKSAKALQDYEQALNNLERALNCELDESQMLEAKRLKGSCLALSGSTKEADLIWRELLKDFPDDHELMEDLIDLQISEGMLEEALRTALKLVDSTSDPYQRALYQIDVGEIYVRQEDRSKAQTHLSDLLDKVGAGSWLEKEILAQLDLVVAGMNDLNAARSFYRELSERYPQRVEVWKRSIQALAASGDVDTAIEQYQELLRLTPGDRQNHEAFVDFLERSDRLERAVESSRKLCELYPEDAELRLKHASLVDRSGDREALLDTLQSYEKLLGSTSSERLQVAQVFDQFGFYDQSGPIYKSLAEANSEDVESVENYAVWLFGRGKNEKAIDLLESMAADVGREDLIRIARTLVSESLGERAYELLKSRLNDFKTDSLYLQELSNLAMSQSVPEQALGWVRTLVLKAETAFELSSALNLAVSIIQRAEEVDNLLDEFESSDSLKLQELCLKAHLEYVSGDSLSVDETVERIRKVGGVIAYSEVSRILEMQGRLDESVEAMESLIAMDAGKNPLNLRRIVGLLQQLGEWDRAIEYVDSWKALTPGDSKVWLQEADLLEAAGRNDEAIQQMRRGLYKFEDDLDLTLRLAALHQSAGEYAEAARIYWRLFNQEEKDSERLRWMRELARLNLQRGTTDQLIEKLNTMRKQQRESVFPLLALAEVYRESNLTDQYRESLMQASNLQPDNPELLRQVAALHENYGDLEATEEALQRLVRIDDDSANVNTLSAFYLRMGETEKAYDLIFQSAPAGGHSARELESIIDSLAGAREWEIALKQAQEAVAKHPDDWRLGYLLGVCLEATGQDEKAFEKWLSLLSPQQELIGLPQPPQGRQRVYYGYNARFLQREGSEAAKILFQSNQTFSYLNQNSHRSHGYGMGLSGFGMPQIFLPNDRETLRDMCALQMSALVAEWDEGQRSEAIQAMRRAGLDCAPILIALGGGRSSNSIPVRLLKYVEENPEDAEAYPLLMGYIHRGSFIPEKILERGYDSYMDENPAVASEFALALLMREPEKGERYVDHIIEYVSFEDQESIGHSSQLLLRLLSPAYGNTGRNAGVVELSDAQMQKLKERVEAFYYSEDATSTDRQKAQLAMMGFNVLATLYLNQGTTEELIGVLEEQLTRLENLANTAPGSAYSSYYGYRRHHSNLQLQLPAFEEAYLELANPMISRFLAKPGTISPGYPGAALAADDWRDLDLISHVEAFSRPELKLLVYWMAEDIENCDKMFDELVSDNPDPNQLFVYATWLYGQKEDNKAAVQTLEQALKHPEARASRSRYEQAIVAVVLDMVRKEDLDSIDEDVLESARSAALRLRKTVTIRSHQLQYYADVLNELGLEDEAERIIKGPSSGMGFAMSSMSHLGYSHGSSRRSNPMDRITELAGSGKKAAAASEAVREVRRLIQQANHYNPPRLKQVVQRITGARLEDEVLNRFDPGETKSRRRMETYAMILEQFERRDEARQVWERLAELRPEEPQYQLELILFLKSEERLQAIRKLTEVDSVYQDEMGDWIVKKMNYSQRNQDLETWMALLELTVTYLEELDPEFEDYRNIDWAPHYAVNVGSSVYLGRMSFSDLLRPNRNSRRGDEDKRDFRREHFVRLIEGMQRHPQLSEEAFILRYAFDTAQEKPIKQSLYEPLALQAIENDVKVGATSFRQIYYGGSSNRWSYTFQGRHTYGGRSVENEVPPFVYLMQLYQKDEDKGVSRLEKLHDIVVEGDPELAASIKEYVKLIGVDDAEFTESCVEWCREATYIYGANQDKLNILPFLIEARGMEGEALLNFIKRIQVPLLAQQNTGHINQVIGRIADMMDGVEDFQLVGQWLESITTEYLGPKDNWQEFIRRWGWTNQYYGGNHPSYKIRMLRQVLANIAKENPELAITVFRFTKKHEIGIQSYALNELRNELSEGFDSVEAAMGWCRNQGLFGSIEDFDTLIILDEQVFRNQSGAAGPGQIPLLPPNRSASIYERALSRITFTGEDKKDKRKAFIKELKKGDFSETFLAAMLEGSSGKDTAIKVLEGKLDAVRAMSEREQVELAYLYQFWFKESIAGKEANPALHLVQSRLLDSLESEVTAYLEGDVPVDQNQIYNERQQVQKWLSNMLVDDMSTCAKLYSKWTERSEEAFRLRMNQSQSQIMSNNRSLIYQAIQPFRNSSEGLGPSIRFIAAIIQEGSGDSFGDINYMTNQIREGWRPAFDDYEKKAAKSGNKEYSAFVPMMLSEFDKMWETDVEAQFAALTLWSYAMERMRLGDDELEDLASWASEIPADASLSHRVFAAAVIAKASSGDSENKEGADRMVTLLGSDEINIELRTDFWRSISRSDIRNWLEKNPDLNRLYVSDLQAFLEAGHEPLRQDFLNNLAHLATMDMVEESRDAHAECFAYLVDNIPKAYGQGDRNEMKRYLDALAKMALKLKDLEAAKSLVGKHYWALEGNSILFVEMIRAGEYRDALRLMPNAFDFDLDSSIRYDVSLHENLVPFLEEVPNENLRFRAKAALHLVRDDNDLKKTEIPKQKERARSLIQGLELGDSRLDAELLNEIVRIVSDSELTMAHIEKAVGGLDLREVIRQAHDHSFGRTQPARAELDLLEEFIKHEMGSGNIDALTNQVRGLVGHMGDRYVQRYFKTYNNLYEDHLKNVLGRADRSALIELSSLAEIMLNLAFSDESTSREVLPYFNYLLTRMAKDLASTANENLPDTTIERLQKLKEKWENPEKIFSLVDDMAGGGSGKKQSRTRQEIISLMLADKEYIKTVWSTSADALTEGLDYSSRYENTDITAVVSDLPMKNHPREPWLAMILANAYLEGRDDEYQEARKWYNHAIETSEKYPELEDVSSEAALQLAKIAADKDKDKEAALKYLEQVSPESLSKKMQGEVERLKEELTTVSVVE